MALKQSYLIRDLLEEKRFIFNGKASTDFRLIVSGGGTYGAPKREYDTVQIPGRDGSLLIDKGYYDDVTVTYSGVGFIPEHLYPYRLDYRLAQVRDWLLSPKGYRRLEDTWHPDEYRLGYISKSFDPSLMDNMVAGMVDLEFTCKPQRYFKEGEKERPVTSGMVLLNLSSFYSYPIIKTIGSGTVTIKNEDGTFSVKINGVSGNATIDCDMMNVYDGSSNLNTRATFTMPEGIDKVYLGNENTITYSGFSKVTIIPRWWRL